MGRVRALEAKLSGEALQRSADLLRDVWSGSPASLQLEALLDVRGEPAFGQGAAALVPEEAVSLAVLGEGCAAVHAEPRFAAWFPDPASLPDLRRLAAQARRGGSALGLLEAADGAAVAAWTVTGAAAATWARSEEARRALAAPGRVLVLVYAPSRSSELAARAAAAFGLTPLEARLAEAFLFAPSLEVAARQTGVGRETARDALQRIMAKTGARRSTDVVRTLAELMSPVQAHAPLTAELLAAAFGLTPAEGRVALEIARGATQKEAGERLGLKPETVRSYAKAVLAKAGVARAKDLARLAAETQGLAQLVTVAEPVFVAGAPAGRLRLLPRGGRRIAFLDYGPASGRPALIFHGFTAGRSLPPALARALQSRGLRPVVVQRPGFGLTSPADGDYLACVAADHAAVAEALGPPRLALFARDGGAAAALAFAAAHPERIARGVLLNPRTPSGIAPGPGTGPVARMARLILRHPHAIAGMGELIRRRTRSDHLEAAIAETLRAIPADRQALEEPAVRAQLIRDMQAQFAHTSAGFVAEHRIYARRWRIPPVRDTGPWTIVHSGAFGDEPPHAPWTGLPGVAFEVLPGAGVLAQFTHAERLAELIAAGG